jgi:26S proteasome regulatory subunit N3
MSDIPMKPIEEKKEEEKKDGEKKDEEKKSEETKPEEPKKEPPSVQAEIKSNAILIDRAVSTLEPRYTLRVLRTLAALRKRLNAKALAEAVEAIYPASTCLRALR